MQAPLRLGSIGLGWWGDELARAAERSGRGRVVACYARSEASRRAFAGRRACRAAPSLEAVLGDDEVEAVLIATPHSTHRDLVVAAAQAGKHVLVEKPLTLTVEAGAEAVAACKAAGVVLQVGHHRRRLPATRALRRLVERGELGTVHLLEASFSLPTSLNPRPGWRENPAERPLGGMTPLGVHMADNLRYLEGPVARVGAFSRRLLGRGNLDDVTTCLLEFHSGALGYLGTSLVIPKTATLAAGGTGGMAWSEEDGTRLYRQEMGEDRRTELPVPAADALADQFASFAASIRTGAPTEVSGESALEVVAILEAAIRSHHEGRPVELAEVGWKQVGWKPPAS
jgi:UDP-N-acetyl-2-amino-2-deoxyglucuronate dehydrogenase